MKVSRQRDSGSRTVLVTLSGAHEMRAVEGPPHNVRLDGRRSSSDDLAAPRRDLGRASCSHVSVLKLPEANAFRFPTIRTKSRLGRSA